VIADIREGFGYVRSQVWLWGTFLAATLGYLIFWGPSEVLLPFIVKEDMGGSASDLGFVLALGGIGAMFAAVVMGNRDVPRRHITFMYGVWTISTLAVAGYGLATFPWQLMVASFVFNALEGAGAIVWATTKGRLVPQRLLGRVSSFDWFISIGLVPVSFALTGPVANVFGARATLVGAGVLGGLVTLGFLFLPGMRDVERSGLLRRTIDEEEADIEQPPDPWAIPAERLSQEPSDSGSGSHVGPLAGTGRP
jgi:MFS family permease